MLEYYKRKLHPGWSSPHDELRELLHRSSSPSKDKIPTSPAAATALHMQAQALLLFVLSVLFLVTAAATFGQRHHNHHHARQQQLTATHNIQGSATLSHPQLQAQLAESMLASHNTRKTCNDMQDEQQQDGNNDCVEDKHMLTAALQQCQSAASKSQASLKETQSAYLAIRSAANTTLSELHSLQAQLAQTKAQLQQLQEQYADLQRLLAQDSYALIAAGDAQATAVAPANSNSTQQDHRLAELAGKVALHIPGPPGLTSSASTSREVVVVVCSTASTEREDIITPWCQSATLAGLNNSIVLAADTTCMRKAQEAGLHSVLYNSAQVPGMGGQQAQQTVRALLKYAAVKVLLARGFSVLAAEPDVLLVDRPYHHLQPSLTVDLHVSSDALDGDRLAHGRAELHQDSVTHHTYHSVHLAGLSPALLHLKPNKSCLEFVDAMLQGLQDTAYSEHLLLDQLLLAPSHALPSGSRASRSSAEPAAQAHPPAMAAAAAPAEGEPAAAATIAAAAAPTGAAVRQLPVLQLLAPPRLRLLPVAKFTTSTVLFGVHQRSEWLARHAPAAIHVVHGTDRAQRMAAIVNSYRGLPQPLEDLPAAAAGPGLSSSSSPAGRPSHHSSYAAHLMNMLQPVEQILERLGLE